MSDNNDEPQTAMMLTQTEWDLLAEICKAWLAQAGPLAGVAPEHAKLADRIIEAAR